MIAAFHELIVPANVTKGYVDHEFVIGSLNDPSARSTCLKCSPIRAVNDITGQRVLNVGATQIFYVWKWMNTFLYRKKIKELLI